MRLYNARIPNVSRDILGRLIDEGDIEVNSREEADLDVQSVLKEYVRAERETTEKAKDMLEQRSLGYDQFGRIKRKLAEEQGIGLGAEGVSWMCSQILETFMQSKFVDEIYAEDGMLRRKMEDVLRRHMMEDEELDVEVRRRIKNLEEGTATWDIEYKRAMAQVQQKRGLAKG